MLSLLNDNVRILELVLCVVDCKNRYGVKRMIVAMPSARASDRQRAVELATDAGLTDLTVTSLYDIRSRRVSISKVRRIELEDLFGLERSSLSPYWTVQLIRNSRVEFVGSIRGDWCYSTLASSRSTTLSRSLTAVVRQTESADVVGDVGSQYRLDDLFDRFKSVIVFHAAAYKHVPFMESENVWKGVQNNVRGTLYAAMAAILL